MFLRGSISLGGKIVFSFIVWFCSLIFIGIGIYSIKRKTPMHFWAGSKVKREEITDIKAYNRAMKAHG